MSSFRRVAQAAKKRSPARISDLARSLLLLWGMATARWRVSPDFVVVGAQRAGTTTLYRLLSEHPGVVRPAGWKGIGYFDLHYDKGLRWYRGHFPLRRRVRSGEGPPKLAFESSGYYLFHPLAAERIARDLPDVKVVVSVRDPVQRSYSAYRHEHARGFEDETFERALELEPERLAGEADRFAADPLHESFAHRHQAYLGRSQYSEQVQRYVDALGADRVHVFDADRFFAEPDEEFGALQRWLGLAVQPVPVLEQHNARPGQPLDEDLKARLRAHFAPYDEALEKLMGRRPSWVRSPLSSPPPDAHSPAASSISPATRRPAPPSSKGQ